MKTVYEHEIGGDGAKAGLYLEDGMIQLKVGYPVAKALKPVTDVIDATIDKLEAAIPGDWDKALLEPVREEAKAKILAILGGGEVPAEVK